MDQLRVLKKKKTQSQVTRKVLNLHKAKLKKKKEEPNKFYSLMNKITKISMKFDNLLIFGKFLKTR